jgi:uncharacterized protein DUF6881
VKVRLKRGWSKTYAELTVGNVYRVLGISPEHFRIICDSGEPILYYRNAFEIVDAQVPASWIVTHGDEGEMYMDPPELNDPPFLFERFFDYDMHARRKLHGYAYRVCREECASLPEPPNHYVRLDGEPTVYIELDEEHFEVRKVEVFADGRATFANVNGSSGASELGERPFADATATTIAAAEFEAAWSRAMEEDDADAQS